MDSRKHVILAQIILNPNMKINVVGIDVDPCIINSSEERFVGDLSRSWEAEEQLKQYGNVYYHIPSLEDFKNKYKQTPFSTILSINSIHYMLNENLMKNINKFTKSGSIFIIKFLDKTLLNTILDSYISCDSSFVRKISEDEIKIYYDWCHNSPIKEKVYSKYSIESVFNQFGWKLSFYNSVSNLNRYETDWEKYFKCFSTIIFTKI